MKKRHCRKMARLGRENARGGSREERNGGHQPEISGLGVTSFGGYLAQQRTCFGLSQKIEQRIGRPLEHWFLAFYPKLLFGSVFWALLEMLLGKEEHWVWIRHAMGARPLGSIWP